MHAEVMRLYPYPPRQGRRPINLIKGRGRRSNSLPLFFAFSPFATARTGKENHLKKNKKKSTCFLSSLLATVVSLARLPGGSLVLVNRHEVMRHQVSLPGHLHGAKKKKKSTTHGY
jgi:hypothetical protein